MRFLTLSQTKHNAYAERHLAISHSTVTILEKEIQMQQAFQKSSTATDDLERMPFAL